ncbi:MAG: polysaccharide biosynthesis C-terminal domain-containing protein [Lachnospiraceae bacterium]|nr:polysaccharide biosynthesis C-terminal domain-containing protein [Lachnospiraceae bacterium]
MGKTEKLSKGSYLVRNMAFFTVSNFVSKILVFLLVPFYTGILSEREYGIADVMQASLLLLVPLLSLNAGEAALRYGLENEDRRGSILRSGLARVFYSWVPVLIGCAAGILLPLSGELKKCLALFAVLFVCNSVYEFLLLFCQGAEKIKVMITGSVSCTILVIACNLFFLLVLKLGLDGYLFSQMISFFGASLILFFGGGCLSFWKEEEDKELRAEMGRYGKSMLLYSTSSWVNNASDRYYILLLLGPFQNGLYGAAYKIPAILMVFQRIFAQSFQMTATKSYKEQDSVRFFSELYQLYQAVMVAGSSLLILFLKPVASFMLRKGFYEAWILVPPLLLSVIFGALNGYLGSICLAYKDGKSMGIATGIGAAVNLVLNYVGILFFGTIGAAFATMVSYFTMFAIAFYKTGKHVKLKVPVLKDAGAYLLLLSETLITMRGTEHAWILNALICLMLLYLYREVLWKQFKKLKTRFLW